MLPSLPEDNIVHISFKNQLMEVPYFVAADDRHKKIIVSIRGTLSLSDALTDLCAQPGCMDQLSPSLKVPYERASRVSRKYILSSTFFPCRLSPFELRRKLVSWKYFFSLTFPGLRCALRDVEGGQICLRRVDGEAHSGQGLLPLLGLRPGHHGSQPRGRDSCDSVFHVEGQVPRSQVLRLQSSGRIGRRPSCQGYVCTWTCTRSII